MLTTPSVRESPNDTEGVFAFHIIGEVSSDDMSAMAAYMNDQFETHEKVSMILIFNAYKGSESGASLDWEVLKSRVLSLTKVDKYAVVDAPDRAAKMVETMGKILPVQARAFDAEDEAWDWICASPLDRRMRD